MISEVLELNLCLPMKIKDLEVRDSSRVVSSNKLVPATQFPGGSTPYNGLYGEAPPERGIFFRPQVYTKGLGFYSLKYTKGQENLSFGSVEGPKRATR